MLDAAAEDITCPICLQAYQQADKAVISSCLHAFCIGCLQAWCRHNRSKASCPLCKRRITGYLYNIKSDADYQEHSFEDEAAEALLLEEQLEHLYHSQQQQQQQQQQRRQQLAVAAPPDRQLLRGSGQPAQQQRQVQLRSEAGYTWGHPDESRRDVLASSSRSRQASTAGSSRRRQQQQSGAGSAAGGDEQQQGSGEGVAPRPYYWRVQQRMLASVTRLPGNGSGSSSSSSAEAALEARRNVYRLNLWATPYRSTTAAAQASCGGITAAANSGSITAAVAETGSSSSSTPRVPDTYLEVWLMRELQALLLDADVGIVAAYVKGLVNSFGVALPPTAAALQQQHGAGTASAADQQQAARVASMRQAAMQAAAAVDTTQDQHSAAAAADAAASEAAASSSRGSGARIPSAVAALEAFLFEVAPHFWHELCCYATSGLTVAAWDRAARYVPHAQLARQQEQQQQLQQQGPAVLSSTGGPAVGSRIGSAAGQEQLDRGSSRAAGSTVSDRQQQTPAAAGIMRGPQPTVHGASAATHQPLLAAAAAAAAAAQPGPAGLSGLPQAEGANHGDSEDHASFAGRISRVSAAAHVAVPLQRDVLGAVQQTSVVPAGSPAVAAHIAEGQAAAGAASSGLQLQLSLPEQLHVQGQAVLDGRRSSRSRSRSRGRCSRSRSSSRRQEAKRYKARQLHERPKQRRRSSSRHRSSKNHKRSSKRRGSRGRSRSRSRDRAGRHSRKQRCSTTVDVRHGGRSQADMRNSRRAAPHLQQEQRLCAQQLMLGSSSSSGDGGRWGDAAAGYELGGSWDGAAAVVHVAADERWQLGGLVDDV